MIPVWLFLYSLASVPRTRSSPFDRTQNNLFVLGFNPRTHELLQDKQIRLAWRAPFVFSSCLAWRPTYSIPLGHIITIHVCGGAKDVRPLRVGQCRRSGVVPKIWTCPRHILGMLCSEDINKHEALVHSKAPSSTWYHVFHMHQKFYVGAISPPNS